MQHRRDNGGRIVSVFEELPQDIKKEILNDVISFFKYNKYRDLQNFKSYISKKYRLRKIPSNADLLGLLPDTLRYRYSRYLRIKPVRSLSGVTVVAVMSKPGECPHGICSYCPRGKNAPQSYTGSEPAAMRAINNSFDPYLQVKNRLSQLDATGHCTDKIELIIMGGTFPAFTLDYQEWFVKRCFDALNNHNSRYIEDAHILNEKAKHRCVGLTFETRPDWCMESQIDRMLRLGATRVEIGVQTLYDYIYAKIKRGHRVSDVIKATQLVKDSGLKINYHIMPGLPGSSWETDFNMIKRIFTESCFKPDMIKIYPTVVIQGTELYDQYLRGEYTPPSLEETIELIVEIKKIMPVWIRTMRIQRDISADKIVAGIKKSNLGELVYKRMEELGIKCRCIRCREIGHKMFKENIEPEKPEIVQYKYDASGGKEIFISYEDAAQDILLGYLRLRFPSGESHRAEISSDAAIVRELHVYGNVAPIGGYIDSEDTVQHKGIGRNLLRQAESIAEENGYRRIAVTSGVGVRDYYRRLGYKRVGPYMIKAC